MAAIVANRAFDRRFVLLLFGTALGAALLTTGALLLLLLLDMLLRPVDLTFGRGALAVLEAAAKVLIFAAVIAVAALPFAAAIWVAVWTFGTRTGLSVKTCAVAGSILAVLGIAFGLWSIGNNLGSGDMRTGLMLVAIYGTPAALGIAPLLAVRLYRSDKT